MPLTTEKISQADQAQINAAANEPVPMTLEATAADTPFPEVDSSSGDHVTNHIRPEKSGHKPEAGSMDRVSEGLRQKEDKSAADGIFSDLRQNRRLPSRQQNRRGSPKGGVMLRR